MIDVNRDLLGAALGGDVLGAGQRRPAGVIGKPEEILRDQRHRPPRAPLPRRVSRRIDDNLTHDSPTTMVRIATRNEEPGQRLSYPYSSRLGPVTVQVPQCGTHVNGRRRPLWQAPGRSAAALCRSTSIFHRTRPGGRAPCWTPTASVQSPQTLTPAHLLSIALFALPAIAFVLGLARLPAWSCAICPAVEVVVWESAG